MNVMDMLIRDEGREHRAYPDPITHGAPWTIGVGHTGPEVHAGLTWTDVQIDANLHADVLNATQACSNAFLWFDALDEARQAVLVAMAFQMGIGGLLKFVNTLAAVGRGDYAAAADGMRASVWARQTPLRAIRMAEQMQTGEFVET